MYAILRRENVTVTAREQRASQISGCCNCCIFSLYYVAIPSKESPTHRYCWTLTDCRRDAVPGRRDRNPLSTPTATDRQPKTAVQQGFSPATPWSAGAALRSRDSGTV